ncbi:amino acid adenylation domain-containing protein [Chryseobacterium capnotolerans]|nr:amino acid adenylation domain-containing protein [Chryseobacterium capnotolerans]
MVRWLPNGELEYAGRNDFQVKIRGHRIELGEIENTLLEYSDIRQGVVLAKENKSGLKYLAAYYVSDSVIDSELLIEYLSVSLPEYMVPGAFVHLTALPVTINGKLDRKALPEPDFTGSKEYTAPETGLQKQLCQIYGDVLGVDADTISIHDDFFRLGGNSIMAIKLISKIKQVLQIQVEVSKIFNYKTIALLSVVLSEDTHGSEQVMITPVKVNSPKEQSLSFAQERLWFIENYEGGTSAYNIPMVFLLDEKTDITVLCKSLDAIVIRHEVLRSVIRITEEGKGWQLVMDDIPAIHQYEVKTMQELEEKVSRAANKIFRLEEELPIDISIFTLEENRYLSVVIHHIAFDGWSTDIFLKELISIYDAIKEEQPHELPALKIQYKDFALWQRNYLTGERLDQQIGYWKNKLSGFQNLDLATDFKRPAQISYEGENIYFGLDADQTQKLKNLSKDLGVSLYSILLGGYYLTLSAYSGQDDIIVGSPIANRHHAGLEDMIGFFVNTLALRENIDPNQQIKDFILQVAQSVTEAQSYQDLPFEKLVEELGVEKDTSRHPVFQVMFGLQSFGEEVSQPENKTTLLYPFNGNVDYQVAKFDLTTMINDIGHSLQGMFNYAKSVFSKETVQNMLNTYLFLLDQIAEINDKKGFAISELNLIPDEQHETVSKLWSSGIHYPSDTTIHKLFENQVERTPDHTAIVYQDVRLSYRELNERSNRLANYLIETYDIQPDDLIPLCLERSEEMLVAILAVLKSGGAYVPMDPSYPADRIKHILTDTGAKIVITQKGSELNVLEACGDTTSMLLLNDSELEKVLENSSIENPITSVASNHLAYVIYTSGTTGMPKGVLQEHRNVARLFSATDHWYQFNDKDVWSLFHSYVFDFSVWEIWGALFYGGKLLVPSSEQTKDTNLFFSLCLEEGLTVLNQTPTAFYQFIDTALQREEDLTDLRYVIFGGEALNLASLKPWYDRYSESPTLINMYGITETTVHVTYKKLSAEDLDKASLIGENIPDQGMYILDKHLRAVPVGAVGELYVGGAGIARGYLNREELTAERFISNPFQTLEEKKQGTNDILYKTGDLVRYLADGELEYIGRNDFQVKIRGYRIELGEIENRLQEYPEVKQAVVLAKENKAGLKYLVGYYVSEKAHEVSALTVFLSEVLPEYMVPAAFVHLTSLPLTINGKLDRRALPEPEFTGGREYTAPETELQEKLCQIYGEVLGLDASGIGIHDDFFRLGGDSIISIQLVSRIRQRLDIRVSVKDIFTSRSVLKLSELMESKAKEEQTQILTEQGQLTGSLSFLPIQEWFFNLVEDGYVGDLNHWNQSFLITVPELNTELLKQSIKLLIQKHDAFRMFYPKENNTYTQQYGIEYIPEIKDLDISGMSSEELSQVFTEWQSHFDIEKGPLFQIGYVHGYEDGSARIFFALHHLIIDAVSWRIITEDLKNIYQTLEKGKQPEAYIKGSSYRQWTEAVKGYLLDQPEERATELTYWTHTAENITKSNDILREISSQDYHFANLSLEESYTEKLIREIHHVYHTQINDILLSALASALSDLTGTSGHAVLLEGHGREEVFNNLDITETVGWFTSMYPLLLQTGKDVKDTVVVTKESLRSIPNNGIGYGSLVGYTEQALPKISFNYLGQLDQEESTGEKIWYISGENSGNSMGDKNRDSYIISVNGAIADGQLRFGISGYLSQDQVNLLTQKFEEYIKQTVDELTAEQRTWLTPSDTENIVGKDQLMYIQESGAVEGVYLANSLQEGFVYHALNQGDTDDAYRVQLVWDYRSEMNLEQLKKAWIYTQNQLPTLRLRFDWSEEIVQIIDQKGTLDWRYHDLSEMNKDQQEELISEMTHKDRFEVYDLAKGSLFRIYLFKLSEQHYTCLFSNHHAILDGWSMPIFLTLIHEAYLKLIKNQELSPAPDAAYAEAQKYLQNHKDSNAGFWKDYMGLLEDREDISGWIKESKKNIDLSEYKQIVDHRSIKMSIVGEQYQQLKKFTAKNGFTINAVLQYLWHKQLAVYSGTQSTVVGTTVSGRSIPVDGIESSVGLYINTLPLIVSHTEGKVADMISEIQNRISELNTHSSVNLASLQHDGRRIFSSLFVYENYPAPKGDEDNELSFVFKGSVERLDYPLGIVAYEAGDEVWLNISYEGFLFEKAMIQQLISGMNTVLNQILENSEISSDQLSYLTQQEYKTVSKLWSSGVHYPSDTTIHKLFENQVERTPDHTAIVYQDVRLSYRELNERSNRLANYLIETYDIQPDDLIPLCLERSEEMLVAILAVLKSGGAYVPMDPSYPADRIKHILTDTGAKIVITQKGSEQNVFEACEETTSMLMLNSSELETVLKSSSIENPVTSVTSNHLAYVIYTSGTTGMPKGVLQEHRNVARLFSATDHWYQFNDKDVWSLFHSYVFDFSVWEIWGALFYGGKLLVPSSEQTKDTNLFFSLCLEEGLTVLNQTPTAFYQFIDTALQREEQLTDLRYVVFGGEALNLASLKPWYDRYSESPTLINMYGITETTVHVTYKKLSAADLDKASLIGENIPDQGMYILDKHLRAVPVGAVGELYVGGAGIARGYLNREELTAERFISNPFQTLEEKNQGSNGILYKTGDLVRYLADGELEYIGRNDFQVKIRGYRIELGEIENRLQEYPEVKQAVVLAKENKAGLKYLVGYYVSEKANEVIDLTAFLSEVLPEYMVPAAFVHLTSLPLTINGKLDRRALPEPEFTGGREYTAPETELQEKLCQIYGEVLGLDASGIGIHDDFFSLGGNSIMAIKLISSIKRTLDMQVGVAVIFGHKTVGSLSEALNDQNNIDEEVTIIPIKVNTPEEQRLSFAQERLWFIETYEGGSSAYNVPMTVRLNEKTDISVIGKALEKIVMRHEVLRTIIRSTDEGKGYQLILDQVPTIHLHEVNTKEELDKEINKVSNKIFRLDEELPIEISIFRLGDHHHLSVVIHHIAFDGWSTDIFLKEIQTIYNALINGEEPQLPEVKVQYKDFALWQRNYLSGERLDRQVDYWKTKLDDFQTLNLPADYKRPNQVSYEGETIHFVLSPKVAQGLRKTSKELGVSVYSVMLGGYYLMLSAYSGQDDIVVGSPIANRHHAGLEDMIGFFVNTLALRETIDAEQNLKEFILQISQSVMEAQSHQDLPFEKLVEELGVEQDMSRHPVFQVMFGLQSFGRSDDDAEMLFHPYEGDTDYDVAKFDLTTMIDDGGETIQGMFNYAKAIFARETVSNMIYSYLYILEQAFGKEINLETTQLNHLRLISEDTGKKITEEWNATEVFYPSDTTIHGLFEKQVAKTPNNIAAVYQDIRLSYRELNERANRLANHLIETYGLQPDDIVPLCLNRSEQMIIAILAVLKSGAAYVPMDPSYPSDRIEHILKDTKAKIILADENTAEKLNNASAKVLSLETVIFQAILETMSSANPVTEVQPDNLAYVIYTSGTTGLPKGVMIEHKSVTNLIEQEAKEFGLKSESVHKNCLWYANYVFDAHVWELYPSITHGHSIYILEKDKQTDLAALQQYIQENNISIATIPPVLLTKDYVLPLEKMVVAGDVTNPQVMKLYKEQGVDLINAYGPTESTVCATLHHYNEDGNPVNIGGAIGNMTVYVLDNHQRPVPVGAAGELYIGGAGIARGYLNRPELTEERFISNPFQTPEQEGKGENGRLYRTGDLVRWLPNGQLEYIGRNDFQVKIRGYRIELGEIENALLSYPGIRQVAVVAKENKSGIKYLAGYYVSDTLVDSALLSEHLSETLPEYMVPGAFVHLEALPLTINGKLDKRGLPEPDFTGNKEYFAPETVLQKSLVEIYGEVLGINAENISIHDDFFRLGGDSIISIQLVGKIKQRLEVRLSVKEIFSSRTAAAIAILMENKKSETQIEILTEQGILTGEVALLPVQEWFFSEKEKGYLADSNHWNQAFLINVPELDTYILEKSIELLIEKHDVFRLYYPFENGNYSQYYGDQNTGVKINYLDVSKMSQKEIPEIFTTWQEQFDIEKGPLYNIGYITGYKDKTARVFFAFHHLIIDTVSWRIILDDLRNIYQALEKGENIATPQKGSSYRQWVQAIKNYKSENAESRDKELAYWNGIASQVDRSNKVLEEISGAEYHHDILLLDQNITEKLIRGSHHVYHTEINDLLLAALASALTDFTGESRHAIVLEGHGREDVFNNLDITETVGWFTSMYPLLLEAGISASDTVILTKEALREIPDHGIGYGGLVGYTNYDLPKIGFNYLGQLDQEDHSGEKNMVYSRRRHRSFNREREQRQSYDQY